MRIQLSDHFTYRRLLRFVLPSIIMMVCISTYSIVDGLFVSNFVGKTSFAAVNLSMPLLTALGTIGFMIGTGGNAIVSRTMGEGKQEKANAYFTMLVIVAAVFGFFLALIGFIFARPIMSALGAEGQMEDYCVIYVRILMISLPCYILQNIFQNFFIAAEKPEMSLKLSLASGLLNVVFDYVFIVLFDWGIAGAAAATAMGEILGGIVPVFYFARENDSRLRFTKTAFYGRILLKTCTNGSSELMTSISSSIVNMLYNFRLMGLAGEDGVAAYGVIMYVNFIFSAIFIGYSIGSAPVVSYHYGSGNHDELKNLFKKSLTLISITGLTLTALSELLSSVLIRIFVGYDAELMEMTVHGFRIYALFFLFCGFNIWGSAFFTALSNGLISALISFSRTLVFQCSMVLFLPMILGIDGVWMAVIVAEILALVLTVTFLFAQRKTYKYI